MPANKAKCKLCNDVIESFHQFDYVSCSCDEISVWGGLGMYCAAKNWKNFVRVDDVGNEIIVKVIDDEKEKSTKTYGAIETLKNLKNTLKTLPEQALNTPVTHADYLSLLTILCELLEID